MLLQKKNYGLKAAMALGSVISATNVVSADQVTVINDRNNGQLSPDVSTQASADQLDTRSTQENGKTVVNVTNMLMFDKSTTLPTTNTSYKEQVRTVTNFKYVDEFGKELKAPTTDRQATIAGYEIAKESTQTTTSHSRNDETRVDLTTHTTTTTITYRKVATTPTVNPSNPTPVTQPVTNTTNMFKYVDESGNTLKASTNTR